MCSTCPALAWSAVRNFASTNLLIFALNIDQVEHHHPTMCRIHRLSRNIRWLQHNSPVSRQVAPAEILFARNSLSKTTAKLLARPPMPVVRSGLTPGIEFPAPSQAADMLAALVRPMPTNVASGGST